MRALLLALLCPFFLCAKVIDHSQEKILICGVMKNTEASLPITIACVEAIGSRFKDYRIIIYENNSEDNTPKLLREWSENNDKLIYFSEYLTNEELVQDIGIKKGVRKPYRVEKIARARNRVLKEAMKPCYDDFKYLIMGDLDFEIPWDVEGILDSFIADVEWDAICANGVDPYGVMYDRWAYRDKKHVIGPELIGWMPWWNDILKHRIVYDGSEEELVPIYSGFGGLALFKCASIRGCFYSGVITEDTKTYVEHYLNSNAHQAHNLDAYLSLERVKLKHKGKKIPIVWDTTAEYGRLECIDHLPLYASMAAKGRGKIFIRPKMRMFYNLTYYRVPAP